jgi:hypothetical protein
VADYVREAAELQKRAESSVQTAGAAAEGAPSARVDPPKSKAVAPPKATEGADARTGRGQTDQRGKDPQSLAILDALDKPVAMNFADETPLEDVLKYVKEVTKGPEFPNGIPIYVDPVGLQEAEKTLTSPIQLDLEGVPLRRTLHLLLRQLGLGYIVEDGLLYITSESSRDTHLPEPMMTGSPIVELQEKSERGELDAAGVKELIEKLKALNEIERLKHESEAILHREDKVPPKHQ